MKILIATYWILPHVGGVWAYVKDLKMSLERLGHEVDVLARHPDELNYYIVNSGRTVDKQRFKSVVEGEIRAIYAPYQGRIDAWIVDQEIEVCCFALAAAYLGLEQYHIIHAQDVISSRALWQIKPATLPLINTIHGCLAADYWTSLKGQPPSESIWKYAVAREYYGTTSSDLAIVPSHWLRDTFAGYWVPLDHMEVIPYGMEIAHFLKRTDEPSDLALPPGLQVIVCPARLDSVKGHHCLLDALYILKQSRNDWVCVLVGDGYLREELEAKARNLGLSGHVIFAGNRHDIPAVLRKADIFVLASLNDNQPFAIMEAQLSGKPVVASNAGGIPEMVEHGHTGIITKAGDSSDLAYGLNLLLTDRPLRKRLAENGLKWGLKQWSLTTMMNKLMPLYKAVLNNRRTRKASHPAKHIGKHAPWVNAYFRDQYKMNIPESFSIVDDHIVGSVLYQAR